MSRMGSYRLWWETTVLVAVCGWCLAAQAKYGGGTGEPNNPYGIATPQDLNDISITQSTDIGPLYDDVPPVHGWIALQAYNKLASAPKTEIGLYLPTSSSSWYYSSTFSAPSGWSNDPDAHYSDSEALIEGAWEEDNPWTRSLEHYWRPDGGYDDGLYLDRSALQKAQEDLWQQAIDAYNSGNKARGYYLLGRVAHLLMDMSVPAHTLLDEHFPDSYETFTENNYTKITSSSPNTAIPSDLPDYPMTTPPSYNSSVTKLFYDLAEKSDDFDSDDEDGESSDYGKGKYTWGRNALNASKTLFQAQYWRWDIIDGWKYLYDLEQNIDYDDFRSCVSASEYHIYYYKSFYDEYNNAFDYRVKVVYTDATSEFVNSNIDEFGDVPDSLLECIHQKQLQSRAIGYVAALYQLFWDSTDHPDTTPPTPNPLTWNTEPYETSTSSISMTATPATDSSTPIYYQFELSGSPTGGSGGDGRDWDTSRVYTDSSLEANHQYGYRVRARDGAPAQNTTGWSSVSYDYTDIETPSGVTFGTITSTSIQVKSSNTPSGLTRGSSGLYIDTSYGTNSGWKQNNDFWTCSGLTPNYDTGFRIKARNGDGDETGYCATIWKYTLANEPGVSSFSNITTNSIEVNWTSNGNYYYTDYFGENVTTGQNSGWVNNTYSWDCTGLSIGTNYTFQVMARNKEGIDSAWTDLGSISALAVVPGPNQFSNVNCSNIQANWTTNGSPQGTEYFCENITEDTNSGWITDTCWNSPDLAPTTTYAFTVKARNGDGIETAWAELGSETTHELPFISNVSPVSGPQKTCMTIEGQNFYDWGSVVFPDGNTAEIIQWTDSVIYCRAPESLLSGDIVVNRGLDSNPFWFTLTDPNVIYVDVNHIPNIENGTPQYPFGRIQYGIDAADPNDEVIIAEGVYTGDGNRDISLWRKSIKVRSEKGPDTCIVDCNGNETEPHFGFRVGSSETGSIVLEGLTVKNGYYQSGGGVVCSGGVRISNCVIRDNHGTDGGGVYSSNIIGYRKVPGPHGGGGRPGEPPTDEPIFAEGTPEIVNCLISNNSAVEGGGIKCTGDSKISNCVIQNNDATYGGGVIFSHSIIGWHTIVVVIDDYVFSFYIPTQSQAEFEMADCVITNNSALYGGGICYFSPVDANEIFVGPNIHNNTIAANSAAYGGGIASYDNTFQYIDVPNPYTTIMNTLVWDNNAPIGSQIFNSENTSIFVDYSNIQGGEENVYDPNNNLIWDTGNINTDPHFTNPTSGDYHLLSGSPCINTGDPNYPEDANEFDIDGDTRIIGGRVDIGADEYAFGELSDFSGNGIVNFEDFAILASYWVGYICAELEWCEGCDFDHSGLVDLNDLRTFAEGWLWEAGWYSH